MHLDTVFLDDGFYICCIDDVEQWAEDCTLRQTEKHDHGAGFVWPNLEDLKTSNQEWSYPVQGYTSNTEGFFQDGE